MPKARAAAAFSEADEDEKTTIESAWGEDEASTTVEHGEVADKIRALGTDRPQPGVITSVTSTNATNLEEPTVDDQRANAALSVITPPTLAPVPAITARLVCTQGNDTGQEIVIAPGKSYSIGRAIDNDFVLTDIAVSRKHFDLRHENGAWVLADRGSGNGTLINGNIEDAPFLLAHGDSIEIGNTTFRFDLPDAGVRARGSLLEVDSVDVEQEEEEPSTVAGKALRGNEVDDALPTPYVPPMRPKTLPPPSPVRARTNSVPPGYSAPAVGTPSAVPMQLPYQSAPPPMVLQPQSTLPLPQMANRPPPAMPLPAEPMYMPTTLPGQAPPVMTPARAMAPSPYAAYPQPVEPSYPPPQVYPEIQQRPMVDPTALVPPTPYGAPAVASYVATPEPSSFSRRAKLVLGGAGLTLLAAAATIAIIRHTESSEADTTPADPPAEVKAATPKFEPIKDTPKVSATDKTPKQTVVTPPKQEVTQPDPPKQETKQPDPPKQEVKQPDPPKQNVKDPPKQNVKQPDPPKQNVKQPDPPKQNVKQPEPSKHSTLKVEDVRAEADGQYRNRQFAQAAATLRNALPHLTDSDSRGLRTIAHEYESVGVALASTGGDARNAFSYLTVAIPYDRQVGGLYTSELQSKLAQIAPKAALLFFGKGQYESAYQALKVAESGGTSSTTDTVRRGLEKKAQDIYNAAAKDMDTNKDKAKAQLKRIKNMVDPGSPIVAKAQQLLES